MATIISFINQKGGVGKTTSCMNVAAYAAKAGRKTLLVDMDPQGNLTSGIGINDKNDIKNVYDALIGRADIIGDKLIKKTGVSGLDILPTNQNLAGGEVELSRMDFGREYVLKNLLEKANLDYDYIMIDCPPSLGLLTVNALVASRKIIIPIQCEFYALEGLTQLMYTVKQVQKYLNKDIEVEGIIMTMYDKRSNLTGQVENELKKFFNDKVYENIIPRNIRLAEAPSYGKSILEYDKRSRGGKAYETLAEEILRKIESGRKADN